MSLFEYSGFLVSIPALLGFSFVTFTVASGAIKQWFPSFHEAVIVYVPTVKLEKVTFPSLLVWLATSTPSSFEIVTLALFKYSSW